MIIHSEGGTKAQEAEAEMILGALTTAYPSHPWAVRVYDGGFFIRHLDFPANWGMNAKYKNFGYSASALKRDIIMMAGEFLERANLKRGRGEDAPIKFLEGVPDRFQPVEHQQEQRMKKLIAAAEEAGIDTQAAGEAAKNDGLS